MKKKLLLYVISLVLFAGIANSLTYMNAAVADRYINVTFINQMPDPVEPGQYVELRFKFENWGSETAESISTEILPRYPFSLDPGEGSVKNIGSLQARQIGKKGIIVKYRLKVDEKAVEGENEINLRYKVSRAGYTASWIKLEPFYIGVQTHDAIIAVESVESEPKQFSPGGESLLTIRIKNLADSALKEIKSKLEVRRTQTTSTTITTTDYPFTPVGSTNEKTLLLLESGKTADIEFNLIADPDAEAKVYKVPLIIEYSDELGENYSKDLIVGLIIGEKPDLAVNLDKSTITSEGQKGIITLRFINKGTNNIKFCYVTLEEKENYKILSSKSTYIGKIDSDDYETVDFDIYVNKKGSDVTLPIIVEYKDANNKDYKEKVEIPLSLYTTGEAKRYGITQGSSKVGVVITVIIVGAGLFFYWRWKKKKKIKK